MDQGPIDELPVTLEERQVLHAGLREWGGPAHPTLALAKLMGFVDVADLQVVARDLSDRLERGAALDPQDWRRAVIATEMVFISDTWGSGVEWETTTGLSDEQTINCIRGLQRKIAGGGRLT